MNECFCYEMEAASVDIVIFFPLSMQYDAFFGKFLGSKLFPADFLLCLRAINDLMQAN